MRRNAWWVVAFLLAALLVGELPHALAAWWAPAGATGFGTAWFVDDFAQYEAAMRQGFNQPGWSDWLIHDPFTTTEPHPAALMFPLYVGIGKLAASLSVAPTAIEYVVEVLARALLVLALWRFCRAFASGRTAARWAFGLALFLPADSSSSPRWPGGYIGQLVVRDERPGPRCSQAPHVPLAMAATPLELARELLRPRHAASQHPRTGWLRAAANAVRGTSLWWLLKLAVLSAAIALLQPFHLPVLLSAALLGGSSASGSPAAGLPTSLALWWPAPPRSPYCCPPWQRSGSSPSGTRTYTAQNLLPSPAPHELLVDLGPTLVLALLGAPSYCAGASRHSAWCCGSC